MITDATGSRRAAWRRGAPSVAVFALVLAAAAGCDGANSPTEPAGRRLTVEEVIEALFLDSGTASEGGFDVWMSFPRGAQVRLVVASSVDRAALPFLERQVVDLNLAFAGQLSLTLTTVDEPDPRPGRHEITLAEVPASEILAVSGEPEAGGTCREISTSGPLLVNARCLLLAGGGRPEADMHEVGHGLGLHHVREGVGPAMMNPSAPVDDFSALELEAIRRVYASGLQPGANRADFLAAGLLGGG